MANKLTIKDLKEMIKDLPDDMVVVRPNFAGHEGYGVKSFEAFKKEDIGSKHASPDSPILSVIKAQNWTEYTQEVFAIGVTSEANAIDECGYRTDLVFKERFFEDGISDFIAFDD